MEIEEGELVPLDELAAIVAEWARDEPDIARVLLFGSRVRGSTKAGGPIRPGCGPDSSDLDVAIALMPDPSRELLGRIISLSGPWRDALQARLPVRLQLEIVDAGETPYVAKAVSECSAVIYDRAASPEVIQALTDQQC